MRVDHGSLRRERWLARMPRLAVISAAVVLSIAGVRSIATTHEEPVPPVPHPPGADVGATGFAETFARAYLSWDDDRPEDRDHVVAALAAGRLDPGAGVRSPDGQTQAVDWVSAVLQERHGRSVVVTVAAGVDGRVIYLAVPVARDQRGLMFVSAHPAIVGPPVSANAPRPPEEEAVEDPALTKVASRAVRNYLARERANLVADLADDAVVALPETLLVVEGVESVTWTRPPARVAVRVDVADASGVEMALRYELEVVRSAGRWLVRSIGSNPSSKEALR